MTERKWDNWLDWYLGRWVCSVKLKRHNWNVSETSLRYSRQKKSGTISQHETFLTSPSFHIDIRYGWHPGISMSSYPKKSVMRNNLETQHEGLQCGERKEQLRQQWISDGSGETVAVWHKHKWVTVGVHERQRLTKRKKKRRREGEYNKLS